VKVVLKDVIAEKEERKADGLERRATMIKNQGQINQSPQMPYD
jgi:hypothetical protein